MKLIPNWKDVFKHISSICMLAYMAAISIFNMLPPVLQSSFDQQALRWGSILLIGVGFIGKFIDQFGESNGLDSRKTNHD